MDAFFTKLMDASFAELQDESLRHLRNVDAEYNDFRLAARLVNIIWTMLTKNEEYVNSPIMRRCSGRAIIQHRKGAAL